MTRSAMHLRRRAVATVLIAAALTLACTPGHVATTTPTLHGDCLSPTGEIVPCPTIGPSPTPSGDAVAPTPSPTATSVLGVAGEAILMTVDPLGTSLEFNAIGLDGSSRLVGRLPNPLASLPKRYRSSGTIQSAVVGEAGHAGIVMIYGHDEGRLIVSDIRTGTEIMTGERRGFLFGPGDRLAIGPPVTQQDPASEYATYELASPSAAPGLVTVPPDVAIAGWLAGDAVGFIAARDTDFGDDLKEVGMLRDGTFTPGEAEQHFRTGIERPTADDRLLQRLEQVGGARNRGIAADPSGTGGWVLLADDGALLLARVIEPPDPIVVARLALTKREDPWDMNILGIAPDGSRVAVGRYEDVDPRMRTFLVDVRAGAVSFHPGFFVGWADTP